MVLRVKVNSCLTFLSFKLTYKEEKAKQHFVKFCELQSSTFFFFFFQFQIYNMD